MQLSCIILWQLSCIMKIAFVGKGGSGKSTISSLFTLYLISLQRAALTIDADLNIHLPSLLGLDIPQSKQLSSEQNKTTIRKYLIGQNPRIKDATSFVKTTPPGKGSQFIDLSDSNPVLKHFSAKLSRNSYFMFVGTYEEDAIGTSCYHSNLSILENILSHAQLKPNEVITVDMVAGIDAFSNSLHLQFDQLVLVVEPTMESVQVFNQYRELAQAAGVFDNLIVIGNKVEDSTDQQFLNQHIGDKLIGTFCKNSSIKQRRQLGQKLDINDLTQNELTVFDRLIKLATNNSRDPNKKLKLLHKLHRKFVAQEYVIQEQGDLSNQIDPNFHYND